MSDSVPCSKRTISSSACLKGFFGLVNHFAEIAELDALGSEAPSDLFVRDLQGLTGCFYALLRAPDVGDLSVPQTHERPEQPYRKTPLQGLRPDASDRAY